MRNLIAGLILASAVALAAEPSQHSTKPKSGYVPDAATAIKIAVAVWEPIYGSEAIGKQKPYRARLKDGVWIVEGTLSPPTDLGGYAVAEIAQDDGRILRVTHGR